MSFPYRFMNRISRGKKEHSPSAHAECHLPFLNGPNQVNLVKDAELYKA